jgi:hypothetical protein
MVPAGSVGTVKGIAGNKEVDVFFKDSNRVGIFEPIEVPVKLIQKMSFKR